MTTAATREQIMEALQSRLQGIMVNGSAAFSAVTRRNVSPETIASPNNPALVLVKHHETYHRPSPAQPPRRTLTIMAIVYIDVGANVNAIPDAVLNPIQDAIDAALVPDNYQTGNCTLDGLVFSAMISGEVIAAPGDKTGKGLACIPIDIIIP
jgi:hypothetical protein